MQEHLYEYSCDSEHSGFLNDVSMIFIAKTDPTNPLQRENYWKHTLKTFAPYGLNLKKMCSCFIAYFDLVYMNCYRSCAVVAALTLIAYHC